MGLCREMEVPWGTDPVQGCPAHDKETQQSRVGHAWKAVRSKGSLLLVQTPTARGKIIVLEGSGTEERHRKSCHIRGWKLESQEHAWCVQNYYVRSATPEPGVVGWSFPPGGI